MKLPSTFRETGQTPGARGQSGSITLVFIGLLSIMMVLIVAESRALLHLRHEVKFMEQQQIKRLGIAQTNTVAMASSQSR